MAKTKKEKQFELNQLMEMRAPQQDWLTREIYENWLKNKLEIKARHTARLIIQDLFPQDSHQLNPERVWGSYEVDESPKTLVDKWLNGINKDNYSEIVGLAKQPEDIRGFGHIKIESIKKSSLFKGLL